MLTEVNRETVVTAAMEHLYHYDGPKAESKARALLQERIKESQDRKREGRKDIWESAFVPKLRELVEERYDDG